MSNMHSEVCFSDSRQSTDLASPASPSYDAAQKTGLMSSVSTRLGKLFTRLKIRTRRSRREMASRPQLTVPVDVPAMGKKTAASNFNTTSNSSSSGVRGSSESALRTFGTQSQCDGDSPPAGASPTRTSPLMSTWSSGLTRHQLLNQQAANSVLQHHSSGNNSRMDQQSSHSQVNSNHHHHHSHRHHHQQKDLYRLAEDNVFTFERRSAIDPERDCPDRSAFALQTQVTASSGVSLPVFDPAYDSTTTTSACPSNHPAGGSLLSCLSGDCTPYMPYDAPACPSPNSIKWPQPSWPHLLATTSSSARFPVPPASTAAAAGAAAATGAAAPSPSPSPCPSQASLSPFRTPLPQQLQLPSSRSCMLPQPTNLDSPTGTAASPLAKHLLAATASTAPSSLASRSRGVPKQYSQLSFFQQPSPDAGPGASFISISSTTSTPTKGAFLRLLMSGVSGRASKGAAAAPPQPPPAGSRPAAARRLAYRPPEAASLTKDGTALSAAGVLGCGSEGRRYPTASLGISTTASASPCLVRPISGGGAMASLIGSGSIGGAASPATTLTHTHSPSSPRWSAIHQVSSSLRALIGHGRHHMPYPERVSPDSPAALCASTLASSRTQAAARGASIPRYDAQGSDSAPSLAVTVRARGGGGGISSGGGAGGCSGPASNGVSSLCAGSVCRAGAERPTDAADGGDTAVATAAAAAAAAAAGTCRCGSCNTCNCGAGTCGSSSRASTSTTASSSSSSNSSGRSSSRGCAAVPAASPAASPAVGTAGIRTTAAERQAAAGRGRLSVDVNFPATGGGIPAQGPAAAAGAPESPTMTNHPATGSSRTAQGGEAASAPQSPRAASVAAEGSTDPAQRLAPPPPPLPAASTQQQQQQQQPPNLLLSLNPGIPPAMRRAHWSLEDYTIVRRLYKGANSAVYKATCNRSGLPVALKVYFLKRVPTAIVHMICREIQIHSSVVHPNIIMLYAAFQSDKHLALVMEYASRGDLFGIHQAVKTRRMDERLVSDLVLKPLCDAILYLHTHGICHRDIKPENVLFTADWKLKLADFGVSINIAKERAVTRAGTVCYMAPEVARCPLKTRPEDNKHIRELAYGTACDIWALGILTYELLVGFTPLRPVVQPQDNYGAQLAAAAAAAANAAAAAADSRRVLIFPAGTSAESRDFVTWTLAERPEERPSALQMCKHPWLQGPLAARQTQQQQTQQQTQTQQHQARSVSGAGVSAVGTEIA